MPAKAPAIVAEPALTADALAGMGLDGLLARQTDLLRRRQKVLETRAHLAYQLSRPVWADKVLAGGPGAYAAFVRWAWHILEPGTLLRWNWHMDVVCDAIQRQIEGDPAYRRLLLILPPGTGKSIMLAGCRDPYVWLTQPHLRTIYVSADDGLAMRDSRRARNIIQSPDYQSLLRRACEQHELPVWEFAEDQNEKANFENTLRGFRQCLGMDSKVTGKRGDHLVVDDPLDAKQALRGTAAAIELRMKEVNETIGAVLKSRVNDQDRATITMMMQRLYPSDPAGMAIAAGGWKVIVLPMEYDPDLSKACGGPCAEDPRRVKGEILHPGKFSEKAVAELKEPPPNGLGLVQFQGQYNAAPSTKAAELYDPAWFTIVYHVAPHLFRRELREVIVVCDASFKKTGTSNVCIETWGRKDGRYYLLGETCRKMGYRETREELRRASASWHPSAIVIEDKANGPALIDDLKEELDVPVVPFDPGTASKAEREELYSVPAYSALSVFLPDAVHAPWIGDYVAEHLSGGGMNDRRDTTSMALAYFRRSHRDQGSSIADLLHATTDADDGLVVGQDGGGDDPW